jgi:hypothetical protein
MVKCADPLKRDIAIWKTNCANMESAAGKRKEDHCRLFRIKRKKKCNR